MKLLKFTFFLVVLFSYHELLAQPGDAATYFAKYITAMKYYEGKGLPIDHEKSFLLMKECSEKGQMDEAMCKLGLMYNFGIGVQKSDENAFKWINESSKKGNSMAHYALGRLYKEGIGTEQNFGEAKKAFGKSAESGNALGKYMLGYMYYRGLGGEQNYEKAVNLFSEADSKGNSKASYMLGVCYKNGYGVKKDVSKANSFLNKAIQKGYEKASVEKNSKNDVDEQRDKQYQKHIAESGLSANKIKQENLIGNIAGEWQGKQYTFDWSKEHILEEVSLRLTIVEKDGKFNGIWYENNKVLLNFSGKIIDKVMLFDYLEFTTSDKFGKEEKMAFIKAKLEMITANKKYLAGEVESYIPIVKEPGYPVYIVAEKVEKEDLDIQDTLKNKSAEINKDNSIVPSNEILVSSNVNKNGNTVKINPKQDAIIDFIKDKEERFNVYPNPVNQYLIIDYKLEEKENVSLSIYNNSGALILKRELSENHSGHNSYRCNFNAASGTYVVVLTIKGQSFSKIIIKK